MQYCAPWKITWLVSWFLPELPTISDNKLKGNSSYSWGLYLTLLLHDAASFFEFRMLLSLVSWDFKNSIPNLSMFEVFLSCSFSSVLRGNRLSCINRCHVNSSDYIWFDMQLVSHWNVFLSILVQKWVTQSLAATIADADVATQTKHSFLLKSSVCILCLKVKGTQPVRLTHVDYMNTVYFL